MMNMRKLALLHSSFVTRHSSLLRRALLAALVSWPFAAWAAAAALVVRAGVGRADALVVLSGSAAYAERARRAAELYREGRAPRVLLTDDGQRGPWSEARQENTFFVETARAHSSSSRRPTTRGARCGRCGGPSAAAASRSASSRPRRTVRRPGLGGSRGAAGGAWRWSTRNWFTITGSTARASAGGLKMSEHNAGLFKKLSWSLPWLARYPFWRAGAAARRALEPEGPAHLVVVVANHFEPSWSERGGLLPVDEQRRRLDRWCEVARATGEAVRDVDGTPFRHTNFYPAEQYHRPILDTM